jgi:hypothetical protein
MAGDDAMKVKIKIGDNDPWHLSWKPLAVFVFGVLFFGLGAIWFVMDGASISRVALIIVGIVCWAMAYRAAVRERQQFDVSMGAKEQAAEKTVADLARDKGAV